jgi:hypothetical protein
MLTISKYEAILYKMRSNMIIINTNAYAKEIVNINEYKEVRE